MVQQYEVDQDGYLTRSTNPWSLSEGLAEEQVSVSPEQCLYDLQLGMNLVDRYLEGERRDRVMWYLEWVKTILQLMEEGAAR